MSSNTIALNNGQQLTVNFDVSKIFIWGNRYEKGSFVNDDYAVDLVAGTLMGRISLTQKIVPHVSDAADGSQYPIGVLAQDITVDADETVELYYCVAGDVAEEKVILGGTDTMDTVISGRSIRDRIAADTVGIKLVTTDELTGLDNQ